MTSKFSSHWISSHRWWWPTSSLSWGRPRGGAIHKVVYVSPFPTNKHKDIFEARLSRKDSIRGRNAQTLND
jgi:hypothetical protein